MKIPKNEKLVVTYMANENKTHIITKNLLDKYTLYKIKDNKIIKIKTSETPIGFDDLVKKDRGE